MILWNVEACQWSFQGLPHLQHERNEMWSPLSWSSWHANKKKGSSLSKLKVPVQRARKFSAVLGTTSAKSCNWQQLKDKERKRKEGDQKSGCNTSMTIRSRGSPPMETSKNTLGFFFFICYLHYTIKVNKAIKCAVNMRFEAARQYKTHASLQIITKSLYWNQN